MFQLQQLGADFIWFVCINHNTIRHGSGAGRQQSQDFAIPGFCPNPALPEQLQGGFSEHGVADEHKCTEAGRGLQRWQSCCRGLERENVFSGSKR
jgi:hypothetical protein